MVCGKPHHEASSSAPRLPSATSASRSTTEPRSSPRWRLTLPPLLLVREMFESSLRGNGLKEICKELNDRDITNRGNRWYKGGLHYLLTNEAYTGTAVWGRISKGEKAQDPVRVEGAWPGPSVERAVRCRAAGHAGPCPQGAETRTGGQQVPAERTAEVRRMQQALLRPGSQERTVRLLHLRHSVQGRCRDVQCPLLERPQGGGLHRRED